MASTFSAQLLVDLAYTEVLSTGLKSGPIAVRWPSFPVDMPTGTADGQINVAYYKRETGIGSGVTTVYDLVGSLTDTGGTVINFDEVVVVAVRNLSSTAANYLTVGPHATNGFGVVAANKGFWVAALGSGGGSIVPADAYSWTILYCYGGVPAAAGSTDILAVLTQSGTSSNTWEILILGRDN